MRLLKQAKVQPTRIQGMGRDLRIDLDCEGNMLALFVGRGLNSGVEVENATRAAYIKACQAHAQAERARLQEEEAAARVTQLSEQLRLASRQLHVARRRLTSLEAALASERAQLEQDFEQIVSLPGVRSIEVDGAILRILTETIYLEHQGRRYEIGEFALIIDLEGEIQIVNQRNTNAKSGWDHPHIQAGRPCLGNLQEGLIKLLGEYQLAPLVAMLLQFLNTFNPDTTYCPIHLWKEI